MCTKKTFRNQLYKKYKYKRTMYLIPKPLRIFKKSGWVDMLLISIKQALKKERKKVNDLSKLQISVLI